MKPAIYVVVNKSLNMSPGKLAAQVGHAVALCLAQTDQPYSAWFAAPHRWMIVLEAANGEQLHNIQEYLLARGVEAHRVIDEGVNEIPAFSLTAVGIGPLDKDSPEAGYLSGLKKYHPGSPTFPYWGRGRCKFCGVCSGMDHFTTCAVPTTTIVWK